MLPTHPYKLKATDKAATDCAALGRKPARMFMTEKLQLSTHFMAAGTGGGARGAVSCGQRAVCHHTVQGQWRLPTRQPPQASRPCSTTLQHYTAAHLYSPPAEA